MSYIDELVKLSEFAKKNKKSPLIIIIVVILTWIILNIVPIEFKYHGIKIKVLLAIIIPIIEFIIWLISRTHLQKNNTNKKAIAFLICSVEIEKNDVEKENFFRTLKNECNSLFNVLVYTSKEFEKFKKRGYTINDIMNKLNLTILFETKERKGNIDNDNNYEIEIVKTHIHFSYGTSLEKILNFSQEFTKCVNKFIKISHKNSLIDNKQEVSMLKLSSMFIITILQIVSAEPEKSFELINKTSNKLNAIKLDKAQYNYIVMKLPYIYLEAYQNTIYKLFNNEKYYENELILNKIENLLEEMHNYLLKCKNEGKVEKKYYKYVYENYLLQKAIVVYEKEGVARALEVINKCDFTLPSNNGAYFSKAFLLMLSGKVEYSVKTYIKLLKRKNLDQFQVEEILKFIDDRQKLYPENIYLNFCYAIINFFRKDKRLALNIFEEIQKKDSLIANQIEKIIENDN